jgi:hypothetical protein
MRLKPIHLLAMTLLISVALIAMSARAQSPAPAQLYDVSGMANNGMPSNCLPIYTPP